MDIDYGDLPESGGGSRRKARLESFLKREIATCVSTELNDPRLGFITITRCELTADFSTLTAYYSLLHGEQKRGLAESALRRASRFIQGRYAKHLRMRRLPLLQFRYDDTEAQRNAMDDLIRRARATDPDRGEDSESPIDG